MKKGVKSIMLRDEIVDEVRAIREAHAAKFNYDLRAIFQDLKKSEAARVAAGHPFIAAPTDVAPSKSANQYNRFAHR
jgi:hypothetical protein